MADYWRYLGAAVGMAVIALTLRSGHRPVGAAFSLLAGASLLLALLPQLEQAVGTLRGLTEAAELSDGQTATVLKLLGVGFSAQLAAQACRDAGEEGLAGKAALCGKMLLMVETLPLITEIGNMTLALIP